MPEIQLQPVLQTDARSGAHLALINRLETLDLSPILVYRMASLADSAVLPMAWQWDVLNPLLLPALQALANKTFADWDQILNVDTLTAIDQLLYQILTSTAPTGEALFTQYRALILLSTSLHSTMGTVGAIKDGLSGLGFPGAVVEEGQSKWGGTQYPSNQGWAVFRVLVDLITVPALTDIATLQKQMVAMCNFWKPARCILDSVQFQWHLLDTLIPAPSDVLRNIFTQHDFLSPLPRDVVTAPFFPLADAKTVAPLHDGRYYHAGFTYGGQQPHVVDSVLIENGHAIEH